MTNLQNYILAVVTTNANLVQGGGAPVFIVQDRESLENKAGLLEKIMDGIAHDIEDDTMIIVRH